MSKILKVCLAMGGGVSLGTYSGSALTEALKLLFIHGKDKDNNEYEDIIVDGMSGASAGAISLAIMLRCLVDYKSMIPNTVFKNVDEILEYLSKTYYNNGKVPDNKKEKLCALEVAQRIQYELWVNQVTAKKLFDSKSNTETIDELVGVLNRDAIKDLTQQYILPKDDFESNNPQVLDNNRVIFACSLTNLSPMPVGLDSVGKTNEEKNLLRSIGSHNHTEVRVLDFVFNNGASKPTDDRWIKVSEKNSSKNGNYQFLDINTKESWGVVVATALACGAFPVAFPPVMLKRYKTEYDTKIGIENISKIKHSWPGNLLRIIDSIKHFKDDEQFIWNSFLGKSANNDSNREKLNYEAFNFPYIDGGTFNNEPIKEAFKIASFQDYNRDISNEDRLVLFVDPIVREEEFKPFKIDSFSAVRFDSKNLSTKAIGEKAKLIGVVSSILGALVNQGSIKENQKINSVTDRLELKDKLFDYFNKFDISYDKELIETALNQIKYYLNENVISIGTRDAEKYIEDKVSKELKNVNINQKTIDSLFKQSMNETAVNISIDFTANLTSNLKGLSGRENYKLIEKKFMKAVFKVLTELMLETAGKNINIDQRSILPTAFIETNSNSNHSRKERKIISLPGLEIQAFAGFASLKAKQYAFEYAKLNTATVLNLKSKNHSYINDYDFKQLEKKAKKSIKKIKFYHKDYDYPNSLQYGLFHPAVDRLYNLIFKPSNIFKKVKGFFKGLIKVIDIIGKGIRNILLENSVKIARDTAYKHLESINIRIIHSEKIKTYRRNKIRLFYKNEKGRTVYKYLNVIKSGDSNELLFQLYLFKTHGKDISVYPEIGITIDSKIKLPVTASNGNPIDPNIEPKVYRMALENNIEKELLRMEINKEDSIHFKFLRNKKQSLYHSLLYSKCHINPLLEYNMSSKKWSFVENTKSLDQEL